MSRARQVEAWNHTASLLAMLANVNRDPRKGRTFKPADFHPIGSGGKSGRRGIPIDRNNLKLLKAMFVVEKGKPHVQAQPT